MTAKVSDVLPPYYVYRPGSVIRVEFWPEEPPKDEEQYVYVEHTDPISGVQRPPKPRVISLKVIRTLSRTCSCVLLVSLVPERRHNPSFSRLPSKSYMILKLCDRRFTSGLREDYKAGEWTPQTEAEFATFQALPGAQKPEINVSDGINDNSWYDEYDSSTGSDGKLDMKRKIPQEEWTIGHREAYLQKWCDKLYEQEVEIYRALVDVQREKVPSLYGTVFVPGKSKKGDKTIQAKGMLLEYKTPSFSLRDLPERVPNQDFWQDIGRSAVKLVQEIGDLGILNRDVRLDNILIVPVQNTRANGQKAASENQDGKVISKRFNVVMIDFGLARLQREDETDEEFRKARRNMDEEGAVGYVLENHLLKYSHGLSKDSSQKPFNFKHSRRLDRAWDRSDEADI